MHMIYVLDNTVLVKFSLGSHQDTILYNSLRMATNYIEWVGFVNN
jgi:hypothetical protein